MKKRNKILISIVVGIIILCIIAYIIIQHFQIHSSSIGTYDKAGFGDSYNTYLLENSEKVLYEFNGFYILGEKSEKDKGVSYWIVTLNSDTWREPKLLKVSSNYLVFSVKVANDSEERKEIAVEVKETRGNFDDRTFHRSIAYEKLNIWEKWKMHDVILKE